MTVLSPMDQTPAVITRALTRRFDHLIAVDRVDLRIDRGAFHGLLGSNGAGKTTLIRMLTTLLPPSSGDAQVAGFDVVGEPREVRRRLGYVPQMLSADSGLTGRENLMLSAQLYAIPHERREQEVAEGLEFMGLTASADVLVRTYSGGMIRRLEIAQAMLHHPAVLLLDEPTVGLDPRAKHVVWDRLRELRSHFGTSILMTTHDMEEAGALCQVISIMHNGQIAASGSPEALRSGLGREATLDDVFVRYTGGSIEEGGTYRDAARARAAVRRLE